MLIDRALHVYAILQILANIVDDTLPLRFLIMNGASFSGALSEQARWIAQHTAHGF